MKNLFAIALLLGTSVDAVTLQRKNAHKKHQDSASLVQMKRQAAFLEKDLESLKQNYNAMRKEEIEVHNLAQQAAKPFAEGMVDDVDKVGETLRIGDTDVASGVKPGFFDVNVAQKKGSRAQRRAKPFAEGMADGEKVGETLRIGDTDVASGVEPGFFDVNVAQKKGSRAQKNSRFAVGMSDEEEVGDSLKMTEWNTNKAKNWQRGYKFAKKAHNPIADAFAMLETSAAPGAGFPNTLALPGPNAGYPGLPSQSNLTAAPENEWQAWAQDFVDWEDNQTDMANTRLPYASTLVQVDPGAGYPNTLAVPGPNLGYPGLPSQSNLTAAPENEWQTWAQDFVDWEDNQTDMANTRLPYASTLVQLNEPVAPGTGYPNVLAPYPGPLLGRPGMPSQSTIFADPENEWQDWAQDLVDWEDNQTDMANTRIPYASAFLQTGAQVNGIRDFDTVGSRVVDDIMLSNDSPNGIETMEEREVPLNYHLVQTQAPDDDPSKLEDFLMEDPGIPLNMRI